MEVGQQKQVTSVMTMDSLFGDLDCNDNTPILKPEVSIHSQKNEMSPTKSVSVSSSHSVSEYGASVHQLPLGLMTCSPEDNLNNDFFYDEDFSVQFDVNLAEGDTDVVDPIDMQGLLSVSQVCDITQNEDDNHRYLSMMRTSKSDTCLYQLDQDLSFSEHDTGTSQEQSYSDQDCGSSSDMSEFRNEPLFSPPNEPEDSFRPHFSTDSLGKSSGHQSVLSGSFTMDQDRYNYDWTANKDQYMLSFDRSPTKLSDGSYYESEHRGSLTSWSQKSGTGSSTSGNCYWSCSGSASKQGSSDSDSDRKNCNGNTGKITFKRLANPTSNFTTFGAAKEKPKGGQLTSWRQMSADPPSKNGKTKLTTWGKLKETKTEMAESTNTRSKSLPDLKSKQISPVQTVSHKTSVDTSQTQAAQILKDINLPPGDELLQKVSSTSLLEMFQKLKQNPDSENESNEALISPNTLQQLMGTWSMSPSSSKSIEPFLPSPNAGQNLSQWSTVKNLNVIPDVFSELNNKQNPHQCSGENSCNVCKNKGKLTTFRQLANHKQMGEKASIITQKACSVQVGSAVLSVSQIKGGKNRDYGIQFPPRALDRSIQTSFEGPWKKGVTLMNRSIQTSVSLRKGDQMKRSKSEMDLSNNDIIMSQYRNERMSRSGFYTSVTLPDLSFLRKGMTQSTTDAILGGSTKQPVKMRQKQRPHSAESRTNRYSSPGRIQNSEHRHRINNDPKLIRRLLGSPRSSRESSPGVSSGKSKSRSNDSSGSFCSSSSSGIDPGSYDSLANKTAQYFSDLGLFSPVQSESSSSTDSCVSEQNCKGFDYKTLRSGRRPRTVRQESHNSKNGQAYFDFYKQQEQVAVPKVISDVCFVCNAKPEGHKKDMVLSHPTHSQPSFKSQGAMKKVEYLQVSPTHQKKKDRTFKESIEIRKRSASHDFKGTSHDKKCIHKVIRSRSQPDVGDTGPLKSCLVKRRRDREKRKNVLLKHRSWSDPNDLAVMKYSQEGQAKYQLITAASETECVHGLNPGTVSLPTEILLKTVEAGQGSQIFSAKVTQVQLLCSSGSVDKCGTIDKCGTVHMSPNSPSPQSIPVMPCPCQIQNVKRRPRKDREDDESRAKKTVSFSEEISYHSPHASPCQSPKKQLKTTEKQTKEEPKRHPLSKDLLQQENESSTPNHLTVDIHAEAPPSDFMVSPGSSPSSSSSTISLTRSTSSVDMTQKKDLAMEVIKATEIVLKHFNETREPMEKIKLGSTADCPDIGRLVLQHLCPAMYAIVLDGLKPHVRSLFGKMKNNVWRVVEESSELGPSTRILYDLFSDLKSLDFLTTHWLKFNAFIFGLMNHKALDFWLTHLHCREDLLSRHYNQDGFLFLSTSTTKHLLLDITTALQPLAQLPFRLEYNFEFNLLREQHQQRMSNYLLDKHVNRSLESQIQSNQMLTQHNTLQKSDPMVGRLVESFGKQTKEFLHAKGKNFLQRPKSFVSFDSLQNVVPVKPLVGVTSPMKSITPGAPPPLVVSSDEMGVGATNGGVKQNGSVPRPITILKDNTCLDPKLEQEHEEETKEGFMSKFTRQVKLLASPEKIQKAYKTGVTDYEFEGKKGLAKQGSSSESLDKVKNDSTDSELLNTSGDIVEKSEELPPVEFTIPGSKNNSPTGSQEFPNEESKAKTPKSTPTENQKRWSDTVAQQTTKWVGTGGKKVMSGAKKRWGMVGSSVWKLWDKMMAEEGTGQTPEMQTVSQSTIVSSSAKRSPSAPMTLSAECHKGDKVQGQIVSEKCDKTGVLKRVPSQKSEKKRKDFASVRPKSHDVTRQRENKEQKERKQENNSKTNLRQVQALCHYIGNDNNYLTFDKGVTMDVIMKLDSERLLCRHGDQKGLVHPACVKDVTPS